MARIVVLFLLALLPVRGLADGMVISPSALAAHVEIPDQRALIHFANGTERLVIETRFTGAGTNFAWVVPLPNRPVVEEASTGLFPTLQCLFQPKIVHNVPEWYLAVLFLIGVGYVALFVRHTKPFHWMDAVACLLVWVGSYKASHAAAVLLCLAMIAIVLLLRLMRRPGFLIFCVAGFTFLVIGLILPALVTAGMSAGSASGQSVTVLERKLVGSFETTMIASRDSKALADWLRVNGFIVPGYAEPVIESYLKDGWVFVATKLRREQAAMETITPHPLSFTFKTERPVYPMRLTGLENGPLKVDMYVFGPQRASAKYFKVERCAEPTYPEAVEGQFYGRGRVLDIIHPLLRKWVDKSPVATKLSATLTPNQMREDVWLDWERFSEKETVFYSRKGAGLVAVNYGVAAFGVGLIILCVIYVARKPGTALLWKISGGSAVVCVVLAAIIYMVLPKQEVRLVMMPRFAAKENLLNLYISLCLPDRAVWRREEARANARELLSLPNPNDRDKKTVEETWENPLQGGLIHEEDSPGNYVFRERDNKLEFIGYGFQGEEEIFGSWDLPSSGEAGEKRK